MNTIIYSLDYIKAFCQSKVFSLESDVKESLTELESLVELSSTTNRFSQFKHQSRKPQGSRWENKHWNAFRDFKSTKIISEDTSATRFRLLLNSLTNKNVLETIPNLIALTKTASETEHDQMADAILTAIQVSASSIELYALVVHELEKDLTNVSDIVIKKVKKWIDDNLALAVVPQTEDYKELCDCNALNDKTSALSKFVATLLISEDFIKTDNGIDLSMRFFKELERLIDFISNNRNERVMRPNIEILATRLAMSLQVLTFPHNVYSVLGDSLTKLMTNCMDKKTALGVGNKARFAIMDLLEHMGIDFDF